MTEKPHLEKLQHLWLEQLHHEYAEICRSYDLPLKMPLFEISQAKKTLGSWQAATRTLQLSRYLILNHSWAVTLQVLKHEMAHQVCSELFHSRDTPHGEDFQRACELLGVLPEYRRAESITAAMAAQTTLEARISEKGQACMAKVAKLLALSQSANEHEAALAMRKANELIEKYHIEHLGGFTEYRYGYCIIDRKRKRIESYQRRICTILHEHFFVRVVLSSLYDPLRHDTFKTIELLGTRENVAIAEYCYHFLENRLALLWSMHKKRFHGSVRIEKNSYYLGLLRGFSQKLAEQKQNRHEAMHEPHLGELIVAEEQQLGNFVSLRFPRLTKVARRGAKVYQSTYTEGVRTGKTISFAEGLSGTDSNSDRGGYLPR